MLSLAGFLSFLRRLFPASTLSRLEEGDVRVIKIAGQKTAIPVSVFTEPETGWMVKAIAPQLNGSRLEFLKLYAPLHEVEIVEEAGSSNNEAGSSNNIDDNVMRQISVPVQELYCHLDPKVLKLKFTIEELEDISTLTRSSDVYFNQADLYARAIYQLETLLDDAQKLQQSCCQFIRESLIGAEVSILESSNFLPDTLAWKLEFQEKYKSINEQYQMLCDDIEAMSSIATKVQE